MATVRVTQPEEPPPPKTYDILGLTEDEMELVTNLVGLTGGNLSWELWKNLPNDLFRRDYFKTNHVLQPKDGK